MLCTADSIHFFFVVNSSLSSNHFIKLYAFVCRTGFPPSNVASLGWRAATECKVRDFYTVLHVAGRFREECWNENRKP